VVEIISMFKVRLYMQLYNICTKKDYEQNGEQKRKFFKIGILKITDGGKRYIKLFQFPDTEFYVFDSAKNLPNAENEN